jgi:hypothetical protein
MVIQALRFLGKQSVSEGVLAKIQNELSAEQRAELLRDASYATDWIAAAARQIAKDEADAVLQV